MERFVIDRNEGVTLPWPTFTVRDTISDRVREATWDIFDALACASCLNSGHVYTGDPVLVAS